MTKEAKAPKVIAVNNSVMNIYTELVESGESNNSLAIKTIREIADRMAKGVTEQVVKDSMKQVLKDVSVKPIVLPSHASALKTANLIIEQYEGEIEMVRANKILTLATRVNCDVKAENAKTHIAKSKTFAELDEATLTKAESQARDNKTEQSRVIKSQAKNLTIEAVITGLNDYLKAIDLKTAKTTQKGELDMAIARLYQVSKNSTQAEAKVKA